MTNTGLNEENPAGQTAGLQDTATERIRTLPHNQQERNGDCHLMTHADCDEGPSAGGGAPPAHYSFSTFPNIKQSASKPLLLNGQAFVQYLSRRSLRSEKDGKLFAPAVFNGARSNRNFLSASGLCLDFDHGQPDIEVVLGLFPGTLAAYYTTHSHTPDAPRFRVVLPLSCPVDAEEHALLVKGVKSILPLGLMECLDPSCFDRARAHYLPSCPPEQERHAFTGHQDGKPLDVDSFLLLGATVAPVEATVQREPTTSHPVEFVDHATGEMVNLTGWAAQNPTFDIVAAIPPRYRRGNLKDGKQHFACPFEAQHTDQREDAATFAANASPPQFMSWEIHCMHSHCAGRDRLEYLVAMLERGWISAGLLVQSAAPAAIEKRRPPRIYYPVKEILQAPEWSTLLPAERRIALDLMAMMLAEDGTIADDDWMIARRLGIHETDWQSYRGTLTRTGWLVEAGGRLATSIIKREFDLAQEAYMQAILGGQKGGIKSVAARRASSPPSTPP